MRNSTHPYIYVYIVFLNEMLCFVLQINNKAVVENKNNIPNRKDSFLPLLIFCLTEDNIFFCALTYFINDFPLRFWEDTK